MNTIFHAAATSRSRSLSPGVSLHLDVVRFVAAMTVFIGHSAGRLLGGGLFWQVAPYMQTAVTVFFVLSGFVIASVLDGRERDALTFAQQRIARVYSVLVPALILTAVCDAIGLWLNPDLYYNGPWGYPAGSQVSRYVLSFFLLNQTWWAPDMGPGINGPFWSMCFEGCYYVAIGLIVFSSGLVRALSLLCLAVVAGPTIIAMFPIWLVGFFLFRFRGRLRMPPVAGSICAAAGLAILFCSPAYHAALPDASFGPMQRDILLADYVDAMAFALHLCGAMSCDRWLERGLGYAPRTIRWLGSMTFALYLFHRPVVQLFAAAPIGAPKAGSSAC